MADKKRFLLRLDPALYNALERWAADELRSVNSQIEFLLSEDLKRSGRLPRGGTTEKAPAGGDSSPPAS